MAVACANAEEVLAFQQSLVSEMDFLSYGLGLASSTDEVDEVSWANRQEAGQLKDHDLIS